MDTKQIEIVSIDDELFQEVVKDAVANKAKAQIKILGDTLRFLNTSIRDFLKSDWIKIKNKDLYYNHSVIGLFPNFSKFHLGSCTTYYNFDEKTFESKFSGFTGQLLEEWELKAAFLKQRDYLQQRFRWNFTHGFYTVANNSFVAVGSNAKYSFNGTDQFTSYHIPIYRLSDKVPGRTSNMEVILQWIKFDLLPEGLPEHVEKAYIKIKGLFKNHNECFYINNGDLCYYTDKLRDKFISQEIKTLDGSSLALDTIALEIKKEMPMPVSDVFKAILMQKLLFCDNTRCDLEVYDEKILTDPNRGHWDLWVSGDETAAYTVQVDGGLMARNPIADINHDGVIGIDFGTKSTVVVYQENSEYTMPMRIGTGQLSQKVENYHYENPTIMEFVNLDKFMEAYNRKAGRPDTSWDDLTTSHTAFSGLLNSKSEEYYAYLCELKQWAGDSNRQIRLRDKQNKDVLLPAFLDIKEGAFNPIELYAYFIGLYINNMHNGIYMDYLLSFPVTYEKAVREKIIDSFSRGIKKSFPSTLLSNPEAMEEFRVVPGASEPAAYAICALQEYGFLPQGNEKVFYSVFDFGGGTTDFDFGLWREAGNSERRYDYVVECFGAGGDQYLGGENLLELLSFEIFKTNQDKLRKEGLTFTLPPECNKFPGSEMLISESQEARLNMTQLMEKMRPFWERHPGYEKTFETGIIKVNLFDKKGTLKLNFELSIDIDVLNNILRERIEKGVRNFFESLRLAFKLPETKDITQINIFLAGNSCKSAIVREIFEQYTQQIMKEICGDDEKQFFDIYPPLGSEAARDIQKSINPDINQEDLIRPTGKTGVAFGLIESRPGARVKIVQKNQSMVDNEIKFKYYIGFEKRKHFTCISDRDITYGEWQEFIDAGARDFTLYYTNLPEANANVLNIELVSRKKCRIGKCYPDANVYYRAVKPAIIEYVVAKPSELAKGSYLEGPVTIELA